MSKKVIVKAANGSGTLEKRGKVYFVRYTDSVDGKRKRVSTGETDKIKAQAFLRKFIGERALTSKLFDEQTQLYHVKAKIENQILTTKRQIAEIKRIPVSEMFSRLFESEEGKRFRPQDISPQMIGQYERFCRKFRTWLEAIYPDVTSLDLITHDHCGQWLQTLLDDGKKDLHRRCLTLLRCIFGRYVEMGYLFQNPFHGFHNCKHIIPVKKRIFTDEEMQKIHEKLKTEDLETQAIFLFCEETGQRFGDVCNFEFCFFRKELRSGQTLTILKYTPRKTKKHGTTVEMLCTENVARMVDRLRKENPKEKYLCPSWQKLYSVNNSCYANKKVNQIIKDAGICTTDENGKTNAGIHSLRHLFVSKLAFNSDYNIPMATIMSMVGHTREDMSEYYAESKVENQMKAINALEDSSKRSGTVVISHDLYERFMKLKENMTDEEMMKKMISMYEEKVAEEEKERDRVMKQITDLIDGIDAASAK